jgi:hypothetical protein
LKQLTPVGPRGEALLDYGVYDAVRAGFRKVVLVIRHEVEELFRRHVAEFIDAGVEVAYARQALDPSPAGRTKPWGTGHAVLAAAPEISGPFAVINADDFYGTAVYRMLFEHLATPAEHALVGYPLRDTLSSHGGVSRGIVESDAQGHLSRLTEVTDIEPRGSGLTGRTTAGRAVTLGGGELAAMNLWGFTRALLPALERQFDRFLEIRGEDPAAEFLLGEAVAAQVAAGETRVRVLRSRERWFGMTFSADEAAVRDEVARLVDQGAYPANLKGGFERLACN